LDKAAAVKKLLPKPKPKSRQLGDLIGRWAAHQFEQYPEIVNKLPDEVFKIDPEHLSPEDLQELGTSIGAEIFTKKLDEGPRSLRWITKKVVYPIVKKMLPGRNFDELVSKGLSSGNALSTAAKVTSDTATGLASSGIGAGTPPDLAELLQHLSAVG
jgi:hypothetical protein